MRFTVTWALRESNRLAQIWMAAPDKPAVRAAADAIDQELLVDAHTKGRPLDDRRRIFLMPPLAVVFTVDLGDCKVRVLRVARLPQFLP
jgi:hypothetical protein